MYEYPWVKLTFDKDVCPNGLCPTRHKYLLDGSEPEAIPIWCSNGDPKKWVLMKFVPRAGETESERTFDVFTDSYGARWINARQWGVKFDPRKRKIQP